MLTEEIRLLLLFNKVITDKGKLEGVKCKNERRKVERKIYVFADGVVAECKLARRKLALKIGKQEFNDIGRLC